MKNEQQTKWSNIYKYTSEDGAMKSNDIETVEAWDEIALNIEQKTNDLCEKLKKENIKALHPDDGWVDRKENTIVFCYPNFILDINIGDLIALGNYEEFRICKIVDIAKCTNFKLTRYKFEELFRVINK